VTQTRRSLRTELLVNLGFVTSAAVLLVGLTTTLLLGGNVREALWPLVGLWAGNTLVFVLFGAHVVRRLIIRPLETLASEAEVLARGGPPAPAEYDTRELADLADRYRAMAGELLDVHSHVVRVEKLAGLGRLAAGVAHEVRNPLGALGTYVEVLRRRGTDPDVTAEMHEAIARVDRIVQGLLDYARPERRIRGVAAGAPDRTDLDAAVTTAAEFLERQGQLRGRNLAVRLESRLACVQGGRHGLEQVVINLLINAVDASPPGGVLRVGTVRKAFEPGCYGGIRRDDDSAWPASGRRGWTSRPRRRDLVPGTPGVILYVADDGPGVPDEDREKIFDPFFTTKPPGEGTGLGLAIVARTVYEAGGVVWVDRAREGGAVFKVFLPLAGTAHALAHR
jgi:two-component system, NtrC family, sensor kinase